MLKDNTIFLIDFDSTFTKVEALDLLTEIELKNSPKKLSITKQIADITTMAMNGELSFDKALKQRINLLHTTQSHIDELIIKLKSLVSDSFVRNKEFIQANASSIFIISGGFKNFIQPIVNEFGISDDHIFANEFLFDENGEFIGYDEENPLSKAKGKVKVTQSLNLIGNIIIIGDGYTDYEIKEAGLASSFYLYTENISRTHLIEKADKVIHSFDELIELHYA